MEQSYKTRWVSLPESDRVTQELSAGIHFLSDFWREKYLREYIRQGGSKIKFVTGRPGSGKTQFLRLMRFLARQEDYVTASFSARDIWLHDFKEIYVEILNQCDILEILKRCGEQLIASMGFSASEIPEHMTFMDYLSQQDMGDALTKREIRLQLKTMFLENPLLDNNFALACSLLTGAILGHPLLEAQNQELLLAWLHGDRSVKLALLRALGLSPSRITKFNARHMLRSLAEVIRLSGKSGLFITIDDMEILVNRSSLETIHYTKLKREDTYESIRQLIDDIDSMKHIMFVFSFDRELMDHTAGGLKSYQALWMRIQNEIVGERFNRFTDIADLDVLARQEYSPSILTEMSRQLAQVLAQMNSGELRTLSEEQARELMEQARVGGIGLPGLVSRALTGGNGDV